MCSWLRSIVSGQSRRFKSGGYDLDLAYVTDHVIAMSFPFEGTAELYRNPLKTVRKMLDSNHQGHYMLFNLCSERSYDAAKFGCEVSCFPFEDHQAPPLPLMADFAEQLSAWLQKDPSNVAVVHCKAGKGRTGTMICAYLLYAGLCKTAEEAMSMYARKRTMDDNGVTNPSQRRYVRYYTDIVHHGVPKVKLLQLKRVVISGLSDGDLDDIVVTVNLRPPGAGWDTDLVCLAAVKPHKRLSDDVEPSQHKTTKRSLTKGAADIALNQQNQELRWEGASAVLDCDALASPDLWNLQGDVQIQVFKGQPTQKHRLAWTWFNTAFVPLEQDLSYQDLDHSRSLSAGSLSPTMYTIWTKVLKMATSVHEQVHLKIELSPVGS